MPRSRAVTVTTLKLPMEVRHQLKGWVESGYPREACGLLVGRPGRGGSRITTVLGAVEARNQNEERARDRFELHPLDHLETDRAARDEGLEVGGVWHFHIDAPARPSTRDRDDAWSGPCYVILSVRRDRAVELRSWRRSARDPELLPERVEP